jgi:hypothetical protein
MSDYTVKELKDIARDKGLKGFSTMNKADLFKALEKAGMLKKSSPKKKSKSPKKVRRASKRSSPKKRGSKRRSGKSRSPSPKAVKKAVLRDFKKMLKADIVTLIKSIDSSVEIKAAMKKDELIKIAESLLGKTVAPSSPVATDFSSMSVAELKQYALTDRGWSVGAMPKQKIVDMLTREKCNVETGSFCSGDNLCNINSNTCVESKTKGLQEIDIDGHKIIGTAKAIEDLKKKLVPVTKKPSPKKQSPAKKGVPLEQTLGEITRSGGASTREFKENLERLKACLGLMSM